MENQQVIQEVWQAFSVLSDAQELIDAECLESDQDEINHAKEHLGQVLEPAQTENPQDFHDTEMGLPSRCTRGSLRKLCHPK